MTTTAIIIFGLLIGSFLNVCIYRVPRKLSVVNPPRSYCTSCKKTLAWWENIPVLSWVLLRGRCSCGESISVQYPVVEILSALAALASYCKFGLNPTGIIVYALSASLIAISFIDLEFKIIPNVISFPGITIGLCLGAISQYTNTFDWPLTQSALESLLGMYLGGGFFYAIGMVYYWMSKRVGLGGGDIKLMGMTGAILGWKSVPHTIFIGSFVGAVVGIAVMVIKRSGRQTEIPFGPWLAVGTLVYIFTDLPLFRF